MTTTTKRPAAEYKVIGKRAHKVGGAEMVTGQAVYAADVNLPGMLYARILRSPHAHAFIMRIDASKALALEGVKAVITGQDMPQVNPKATFPMGEGQMGISGIATVLMAHEKALFVGHPVAAVAATDPLIAEQALGLIQVDYEVLPAALDVLEAMKPTAPVINSTVQTKTQMRQIENPGPTNVAMHATMSQGDIVDGFKQAEAVVEREYVVATAHQGYIEPQAATAHWKHDGSLTVWTSTQGSFTAQQQIATILGLPQNQVVLIPTEIGGAFGGKIHAFLEPVVALLSKKTGRPVKGVLSRKEVLETSGPGSACVIRVKAGAKKDGTLTAIQVWSAFEAGCVPGSPMMSALVCAVAPYNCPNMLVEGYDVLTNKVGVAAYRAPGSPQGAFAMEQTIDAVAQAIGMDPLQLRVKNAPGEGDLQVTGSRWNRIGLKEIYSRIASNPHWKSRLAGPNRGRGLAVGFWPGGVMTSGANVKFNPDGTVSVLLGIVDLTGTRTAARQVVAEELDMDPEDVTVTIGSTDKAPYNDLSGGSHTTYTMSAAIHHACHDLLGKLQQRAAEKLKVKPEEIEYVQRTFRVKGAADKFVHVKDVARAASGYIVGTGSISRLGPVPAFAAAVADVEVDPETGKTTILRFTAFQDCGKAVNPTRVEAQMQGGAAQGIGWGLTEEYIYDENGKLLNASLLDYRQPTAMDVPNLDCEIIEVPASDGPYGIRGVGEPPICAPAAALGNAIARATGVRVTHMPMTMDRVYAAMKKGSR